MKRRDFLKGSAAAMLGGHALLLWGSLLKSEDPAVAPTVDLMGEWERVIQARLSPPRDAHVFCFSTPYHGGKSLLDHCGPEDTEHHKWLQEWRSDHAT